MKAIYYRPHLFDMNNKGIILFLITALPLLCLAQEVQLGIGMKYYSTNSSLLRVKKLVLYKEPMVNYFTEEYSLGYQQPLGKRFEWTSGIRYYNFLNKYHLFEDTVCSTFFTEPTLKVAVVGSRILEFPQQVIYNFYHIGSFDLGILAGITPVWRFSNSNPQYNGPISDCGWTDKVADAYNKLGTLAKPFFLDYSYGFQFRYRSFLMRIYYQKNISPSITGSFTDIQGRSHQFQSNSSSLNFMLTYALKLTKI